MTTPPPITVTLENAKLLREAGWPLLTTRFYWTHTVYSQEWACLHESQFSVMSSATDLDAPTPDELWPKLPLLIHVDGQDLYLRVIKSDGPDDEVWTQAGYTEWGVEDIPNEWMGMGLTLADALADLYCLLASKNLLPSA